MIGIIGIATGSSGLYWYETLLDIMLRYMIPCVLALHASQTVAEEVQYKTITYLYTRPIPRWALPVGKYVGLVAMLVPMVAISTTASYVLAMIPDSGQLGQELSPAGRRVDRHRPFGALLRRCGCNVRSTVEQCAHAARVGLCSDRKKSGSRLYQEL